MPAKGKARFVCSAGCGTCSAAARLSWASGCWPTLRPWRFSASAASSWSAAIHGVAPRTISFTGAMPTLEAFQPLLEFGAAQEATSRLRLYHDLLAAIPSHRVGDRPDCYEPQLIERRRNNYDWLTEPRAKIKRKMAKGFTKN